MHGRRTAHSCTSHPIPGIAVPELAPDRVQLVQKQLRLTADQAHLLFFIANSSCLLAWMGKPDYLTLTALDLTFCISQYSCQSVDYLGTSWELHVTAAFRAEQCVHTKRHTQHSLHQQMSHMHLYLHILPAPLWHTTHTYISASQTHDHAVSHYGLWMLFLTFKYHCLGLCLNLS